jgi:hypothetical protein
MVNLNPDTISLVKAADPNSGCTAEELREAFAAHAQRAQTLTKIRGLVQTYARLAAISAPVVVSGDEPADLRISIVDNGERCCA